MYSYVIFSVIGHLKQVEKGQQDITMGKKTSVLDTSTSGTKNVINSKELY